MTLFVVPLFMSPVIVGTFFSLILTQPYGPTNYLLGKLLGHPVTIDFTNDSPWVYLFDHPGGCLAVDAFHVCHSPRWLDVDFSRSV